MNEKVDRTCATCACSIIRINPADKNHKQMFCRLNPAGYQVVNVEVPRIENGKPVMSSKRGEENKPLMTVVEQPLYIYPPTTAELVCFAGWRPIGTEPGQKNMKEDLDTLIGALEPIFSSLGIIIPIKPPLDG